MVGKVPDMSKAKYMEEDSYWHTHTHTHMHHPVSEQTNSCWDPISLMTDPIIYNKYTLPRTTLGCNMHMCYTMCACVCVCQMWVIVNEIRLMILSVLIICRRHSCPSIEMGKPKPTVFFQMLLPLRLQSKSVIVRVCCHTSKNMNCIWGYLATSSAIYPAVGGNKWSGASLFTVQCNAISAIKQP